MNEWDNDNPTGQDDYDQSYGHGEGEPSGQQYQYQYQQFDQADFSGQPHQQFQEEGFEQGEASGQYSQQDEPTEQASTVLPNTQGYEDAPFTPESTPLMRIGLVICTHEHEKAPGAELCRKCTNSLNVFHQLTDASTDLETKITEHTTHISELIGKVESENERTARTPSNEDFRQWTDLVIDTRLRIKSIVEVIRNCRLKGGEGFRWRIADLTQELRSHPAGGPATLWKFVENPAVDDYYMSLLDNIDTLWERKSLTFFTQYSVAWNNPKGEWLWPEPRAVWQDRHTDPQTGQLKRSKGKGKGKGKGQAEK